MLNRPKKSYKAVELHAIKLSTCGWGAVGRPNVVSGGPERLPGRNRVCVNYKVYSDIGTGRSLTLLVFVTACIQLWLMSSRFPDTDCSSPTESKSSGLRPRNLHFLKCSHMTQLFGQLWGITATEDPNRSEMVDDWLRSTAICTVQRVHLFSSCNEPTQD